MSKALSTGAWLDRAIEKLGSNKAVAEKLGRSPSYISDVRRGRRPGANLLDAARDIAKGKRQPATPPPSHGRQAKMTPEQKHAQKVLAKGQRRLDKLDDRGVDKVVIYINRPGAGKSFTLCANGGVSISEIYSGGGLGAFCAAQAKDQGYSDDLDYAYVDSIELEEYY